MTKDPIWNFIAQRVKDVGYQSVNFDLALTKEGELWKILFSRIVFDVSEPSKPITFLEDDNFVIKRFSISINQFNEFFDYLIRMGAITSPDFSKLTDGFLYTIGDYKLCFLGNFLPNRYDFHGRERAKRLYGIDKPIYRIEYSLQNSVISHSYQSIDVSGHTEPFTSVFDAVNYHWHTQWQQYHLPSVSCGIFLPIFDASIKNVEFVGNYFNVELDLPSNSNKINELSVGINTNKDGQLFVQRFPIEKNVVRITMPFKPTFATLFLHKNKEKLDEYYWNLTESITDKTEQGETMPLEIPYDDFESVMKVFISHKFIPQDQQLALTLREILKTKKIKGYLAESKKEYELLIGEKIRKEIEDSDYVVGIITQESEKSASVNQELGYALGKEIPVIIMLEKEVQHGVLTHGREVEEFTRDSFVKPCNRVLDYIVENGPARRPYSEQEKILATKSAHFRYELEQELSQFMEGILVYYQIEPKGKQIFFDEKGRENAHRIIENFTKEREKMYEKISKLELRNLVKIHNDYILLKRGIEDAERFPHANLFEDEEDAFLKLKERIAEVSDFSIDIIKYLQKTLQILDIDYDTTFEKIIVDHSELVSLPRYFMSYIHDIVILTRAVIDLDQILLKIRKKFGNIALKDTYDKDSV